MPISSHAVIPHIIQEMLLVQPKKVLDIGIGNGMWGALVYNYADVLLPQVPYIVGIEPWKDYAGPLWGAYNEIHHDPLEAFVTHHKFDLIIMADVIEHLEPKEGRKQLRRFKGMLSPGGVMIVSTPAVFMPQGAYAGNPWEEHKSLWVDQDFKEHGFKPITTYKSIFGEKMTVVKYKQEEK